MAWTVPEPHVAIRLHRLKDITLNTLVGYKVMPDLLANLLAAMVIGGASIVTSGPMGSGKTTLTRALANALPLETTYRHSRNRTRALHSTRCPDEKTSSCRPR